MTDRFLPSEYIADPERAAAVVAARLADDPCSEPVGSLGWTEHVGAILDDTDLTQPEAEVIDGVEVDHPEHDSWRTDFWIEVEKLAGEFYDPDGFGAIDYADRLLAEFRGLVESWQNGEMVAMPDKPLKLWLQAENLLAEIDAESAENRAGVDEPELVCGDCLSHYGAQDGAIYRVVPVDDCPQDTCHGKRLA